MKKTLSILSLLVMGLGSQLSAQSVWAGSTISTITNGKVGIGTGTSVPEGKLSIRETQSITGGIFGPTSYTGKSLVIENTHGIGNAEFNIMEVHNRPATMPESSYSLMYWLSNKGNLGLKGNITANNYYTFSDVRLKKNIASISDEAPSILELNSIQYNFKDNAKENSFDEKVHFGFSAQEVQKLYPNLVEEQNGYLKVNYIEFIPLLLQQIKDQNKRIEVLEEAIKGKSNVRLNDERSTSIQNSTLGQNVPNPFDKETSIHYTIKQNFNSAFIGVYDLNGKQIKRIPIDKSKSEITIPANIFVAGTYIYSLIIDGKLIDSKKMIVI